MGGGARRRGDSQTQHQEYTTYGNDEVLGPREARVESQGDAVSVGDVPEDLVHFIGTQLLFQFPSVLPLCALLALSVLHEDVVVLLRVLGL